MGLMEKVAVVAFAQHQVWGAEIDLAQVVLVPALEFELPGLVLEPVAEFGLVLPAVVVELAEVVQAEVFAAKPGLEAMPGCLRALVEGRQ
jgi:hypothetical protein